MKRAYTDKMPAPRFMPLIVEANKVIEKAQKKGHQLTLRQVYYQLVAHHGLANNDKNYALLGDALSEGRMAGLVDWDAIEDRTRNLRSLPMWSSTHGIMRSVVYSYRQDKWADQPYRPEVWVEKDALIGVFAGVCNELEVPYIACRGYMSQSEMWAAAEQRFAEYLRNDQKPYILHFGDHDPSGIDMSRDIQDRLDIFLGQEFGPGRVGFKRMALNMAQVRQYKPPPNPAKLSDGRAKGYIERFGLSSWELDALEYDVLEDLVREEIEDILDEVKWDQSLKKEEDNRKILEKVSKKWDTIIKKL